MPTFLAVNVVLAVLPNSSAPTTPTNSTFLLSIARSHEAVFDEDPPSINLQARNKNFKDYCVIDAAWAC